MGGVCGFSNLIGFRASGLRFRGLSTVLQAQLCLVKSSGAKRWLGAAVCCESPEHKILHL